MFYVDLPPLFCVTQTVLCAMWTLLSPTQGSSLGESIVVEAGPGGSPMSTHGQLHLFSTSTKTWRLRRSRLLQRRLWLKRNPGANKQCQPPCSLLLTGGGRLVWECAGVPCPSRSPLQRLVSSSHSVSHREGWSHHWVVWVALQTHEQRERWKKSS